MWSKNRYSVPKKRKESVRSLERRLRRANARKDKEAIDDILRQLFKRGIFEAPEIREALNLLRGE